MKPNNIFKIVDKKLRSVIKGMSMGDYVNLLPNASPLAHDINKIGKKTAFTNCNIFDGLRPELKEDMAVLVEGDKILDVGHREQVTIPYGYFVVDAEVQTMMPGIIDSHVHECSPFTYVPNRAAIRQMPIQVALNNMRTVSSGVTTVCDMGGGRKEL